MCKDHRPAVPAASAAVSPCGSSYCPILLLLLAKYTAAAAAIAAVTMTG